jgi:hypothetical protein
MPTLKSKQIRVNPPSFKSANDLRHRIESLPAGPQWKSMRISIGGYTTKSPIRLYWRDGLAVIKHLFSNPIFAPSIELAPYRSYESTDTGEVRTYNEFMSADLAWEIQVMFYP